MADFVSSLEIPLDVEQVGDREGRDFWGVGEGGGVESDQGLSGVGRRRKGL